MKTKFEPSIQERTLRAFLDLVILRMLMRDPMTAYEIDNAILKKLDGKRSPNVVYTRLATMERNDLTRCVKSKHGKTWHITEKGKQMVDDMPNIIREIQSFAPILLGN